MFTSLVMMLSERVGNLTLGARSISLAQYDVAAREWSDAYEPQLYVYGETGKDAEVFDMAVNRSARAGAAAEEAIVVGQFDSISEESQSQYCSVGRWVGMRAPAKALARVGEGGLCSRASDPATRIYATTLGARDELFVGGTFSSRVWDGGRFATVEHLAVFDAKRTLWMPLRGGSLALSAACGSAPAHGVGNASEVSVLALAYARGTLFVGGRFDRLGAGTASDGLVLWTRQRGLEAFVGGGLHRRDGKGPGVAHALAVDDDAGVLYVAGTFDAVGGANFDSGLACDSLAAFAVWDVGAARAWRCIHEATHSFDARLAPIMLLHDGTALYAAGRPAPRSAWWRQGNTATAAIARFLQVDDANRDAAAPIPRTAPTSPSSSSPKASSDVPRDRPRGHKAAVRRRLRSSTPPPPRAKAPQVPPQQERTQNGSALLRAATWEWLPGWRGVNGTVLALGAGVGSLEGSVVVGGAFDGSPPLVVWRRDDTLGPYTMGFGSGAQIGGTVYAIATLYAAKPRQRSAPAVEPSRRSLVVFLALLSGTCLFVVALAYVLGRSCRLSAYGYGSRKPPGISLQTLSYGFAPDLDFEFSDAYEHAMQARHLANRHALVMIDPSEIVLRDVIGEGSFGRVWSASWQSSDVAVKEFVLAQAAFAGGSIQRRDIIEEIVGEAGIMAYLRHPKILQLYGCSLTAQAIWIVSELCSHGSLRQVLDDASLDLSLEARLRMAIDVAEGMLYLHTRDHPIVHRDLKSHNLFVAEVRGRMHVRIGDWGSARAVAMSPDFSKTMTHGVGTTCWLAPELIKDAKGSERIDVYAFGIVVSGAGRACPTSKRPSLGRFPVVSAEFLSFATISRKGLEA